MESALRLMGELSNVPLEKSQLVLQMQKTQRVKENLPCKIQGLGQEEASNEERMLRRERTPHLLYPYALREFKV